MSKMACALAVTVRNIPRYVDLMLLHRDSIVDLAAYKITTFPFLFHHTNLPEVSAT